MLDTPAFLGVEASVTGRRWLGPEPEIDRLGLAIAQATGLPEIVGRVLARRGVGPAEAALHLAPALRDLMPDPSSLRDMDRAADRFLRGGPRRASGSRSSPTTTSTAAPRRRWSSSGCGAMGLGRDALRPRPDRRGLRPERPGDAPARRRRTT